jgi:hypothetical protein
MTSRQGERDDTSPDILMSQRATLMIKGSLMLAGHMRYVNPIKEKLWREHSISLQGEGI